MTSGDKIHWQTSSSVSRLIGRDGVWGAIRQELKIGSCVAMVRLNSGREETYHVDKRNGSRPLEKDTAWCQHPGLAGKSLKGR